jgi:branched-chain amino acid transport system ATP-binding protein
MPGRKRIWLPAKGAPPESEAGAGEESASRASGEEEALLELRHCHVRYGLVPALRGVSLKVMSGEMVALLGANGAGKSTTLRSISGLVHPHSGEIRFQGKRIDSLRPPGVVAKGIAHLPEGRDLFPGLSVRENLRYGYWPRRRNRGGFKPQLNQVFEAFPKLRERRRQKAGTLSGGEQQMLAVGMALMSQPELLLVDELSLGLAPKVVAQLFETLTTVNRSGTAILLVEQFVPLALANTSRAYVLAKGEVAVTKASAELKDDPSLLASYLGETAGSAPTPTSDASKAERPTKAEGEGASGELHVVSPEDVDDAAAAAATGQL